MRLVLVLLILVVWDSGCVQEESPRARRPNILFAISDDQSWLHAGAYGDPLVRTPAFDRVAKEGVRFTHAFTAAPSCTPSRSAILAGQEIWRLKEAGLLFGTYPTDLDAFPLMLEEAGYHIGYTGKGWSPGDFQASGRTRYPLGRAFNEKRITSPREGISPFDYAANFRDFLATIPEGSPFFFWFGALEPHLPYRQGAGLEAGRNIEDVRVPAFLPDTDEIRGDILDYYTEIEWFDRHLGSMLQILEEAGALENTLVIVTSDNGMPLPRSKTTLYDWGVRMPLAVRWPPRIVGGRVVDDFVSLTDFAPTLLEVAGISKPQDMTGRTLLPILLSDKAGRVDNQRNRVFTAIERHTWCRPQGLPYPRRAIRTYEYLYIRNYEPDRWPGGDPDFDSPHQGFYGDVDNSPTKTFMLDPVNRKRFSQEFAFGFGKLPAEELYLLQDDPDQINNLAADPDYAEIKAKLKEDLERYLSDTGDPRSKGLSPWDDYPYYFGDYAPRPTHQ